MNRNVTWLFVPGADEKKLKKAGKIHADVFIYDLEDAVAVSEKEHGRQLVTNIIKSGSSVGLKYARINNLNSPFYDDDLDALITNGLDGIVLPKTESAEEVAFVDRRITQLEQKRHLKEGAIKLVPLVESARGLYFAYDIAAGSVRVAQLAFGSVDFSLNIHATLTKKGDELLYARSHLVTASRAAGIQAPIDTVFTDITDHQGFLAEAAFSKKLGFHGKLLIHPDQVALLNSIFRPTPEEIREAQRIISAYSAALDVGRGTCQVDGKMVDRPVFEKARQLLDQAGEKKSLHPMEGE